MLEIDRTNFATSLANAREEHAAILEINKRLNQQLAAARNHLADLTSNYVFFPKKTT